MEGKGKVTWEGNNVMGGREDIISHQQPGNPVSLLMAPEEEEEEEDERKVIINIFVLAPAMKKKKKCCYHIGPDAIAYCHESQIHSSITIH